MLLKLRGVGKSDRSKLEDQLEKDKNQFHVNMGRLDFVNDELRKLEKLRNTSASRLSMEAVTLLSGRKIDMTIAAAIHEYLQQKTTLERCMKMWHQTYEKHCEPLNQLNQRLHAVPSQAIGESIAAAASVTSPQSIQRWNPAW